MKIFDKDISGVIFDLDGTLLDSSWVWLKVDADFLAENGIAVTDDYTEAVHQMHFNEAALYTKTRYSLEQSVEQIKDRWIEMVEQEYAHNIRLKDGAYDFIRKLIRSGVKVAFATTLFKKVAIPCLVNNKLTQEHLGIE
ncbi:MAG: HAD hydrolase-like protein, partial [Clostridia bacterium]|nr:HAD hydrolase-like protein [Clostridia bacterium]